MEGNYATSATPHLDSASDCLAIMEGFPTTSEVPFSSDTPSLDGEEANYDAEVTVNGPIKALVPTPTATDVSLAVFAREFLSNLAQVYDVDLPVVTAELLIDSPNSQSKDHAAYVGMLGDMGSSFQAPIQQVLSAMDGISQAAAEAIGNNVVPPSMNDTSMEDLNASSFPPAFALASESPIINLDESDVIPSLEIQATAKAKAPG
ncbi:hypothetical protein AMTR_s00028p00090000 [Amborella trichopoda]|uniref:Uncharacterized protein n=1 Tax=Amborella trichopoda TaxID=13333 RepID=W1PS83_AMBTC|nr:hypothetical protein AMTR_s00028p00090000 [Amborella trichopoda]